MINCTSCISGISFRFIQPDSPRDNWYTVMGRRDDGSRAMLLEVPTGFQLSRGEAVIFLEPGEALPLTAVGTGVEVASWRHQIGVAAREVSQLIPPGEAFILVDQEEFGGVLIAGRRAIPFLERDGQYWGSPPDDATAIQELERLRFSGASFIVFAWPAFWWLDHYVGLRGHLHSKFRCVMENERLVAFDLRSRAGTLKPSNVMGEQ